MTDEEFAATLGLSVAEAREQYLEAILGLIAKPLADDMHRHIEEHGCANGHAPYPTTMDCPEAARRYRLVPFGYFVLIA